MSIKIYNTLTSKKEKFVPISLGSLTIYLCGITVYGACHIGHARTNVILDVILRCFIFSKFKVNFVRNTTDIDDKIIFNSKKIGIPVSEFTECIINGMDTDFSSLNLIKANRTPRVSQILDKICEMIQVLINKDYAYIKLI